jgi:hypothetical protein
MRARLPRRSAFDGRFESCQRYAEIRLSRVAARLPAVGINVDNSVITQLRFLIDRLYSVANPRVRQRNQSGQPPRLSHLFLFHRDQFTVKLNVVLTDGLVASELPSVNAFAVTV